MLLNYIIFVKISKSFTKFSKCIIKFSTIQLFFSFLFNIVILPRDKILSNATILSKGANIGANSSLNVVGSQTSISSNNDDYVAKNDILIRRMHLSPPRIQATSSTTSSPSISSSVAIVRPIPKQQKLASHTMSSELPKLPIRRTK